jgi:hypothetical protein
MDEAQINFFTETVGAIFVVEERSGYSFFEGYVIDALAEYFENELVTYELQKPLELLKGITDQEGRKRERLLNPS